jgi:hypothetical protein
MAGIWDRLFAGAADTKRARTREKIQQSLTSPTGLAAGRIAERSVPVTDKPYTGETNVLPLRQEPYTGEWQFDPLAGLIGASARTMANAVTYPGRAMRGEVPYSGPEAAAWAADTAGLMSMGSMPAAAAREGSSLGIFGGRMAQGAPLDDLARAEMKEAAGEDANAIWRSTGWGRGADGEWRFEIDDSNSRISAPASDVFDVGLSPWYDQADATLLHKDLYSKYPDVAGVNTSLSRQLASSGGHIGHTDSMFVEAPNLNDARSVMLHELQHAIQKREGFAHGGATDDLGQAAIYPRLAGEVEARNVQKRADLDAIARRLIPPWATEDVPRHQQIVRRRQKDAK